MKGFWCMNIGVCSGDGREGVLLRKYGGYCCGCWRGK